MQLNGKMVADNYIKKSQRMIMTTAITSYIKDLAMKLFKNHFVLMTRPNSSINPFIKN
jgi:hypothetical protein